mmetsp:Transcript_25276/g.73135  ORF Transcript_25276/g.73135 Transcript_25276/m.73135 type:complete len:223 (+) Transcript_25276:1349-2017(+)
MLGPARGDTWGRDVAQHRRQACWPDQAISIASLPWPFVRHRYRSAGFPLLCWALALLLHHLHLSLLRHAQFLLPLHCPCYHLLLHLCHRHHHHHHHLCQRRHWCPQRRMVENFPPASAPCRDIHHQELEGPGRQWLDSRILRPHLRHCHQLHRDRHSCSAAHSHSVRLPPLVHPPPHFDSRKQSRRRRTHPLLPSFQVYHHHRRCNPTNLPVPRRACSRGRE